MTEEMGNLEYRYGHCDGNNHINVAVNPTHYDQRLNFAVRLAAQLYLAIPFDFQKQSEPEIRVLGGRIRKHMLSIEMKITPNDDMDSALRLLEENGWESLQDAMF